jgi:hypothetical protein
MRGESQPFSAIEQLVAVGFRGSEVQGSEVQGSEVPRLNSLRSFSAKNLTGQAGFRK